MKFDKFRPALLVVLGLAFWWLTAYLIADQLWVSPVGWWVVGTLAIGIGAFLYFTGREVRPGTIVRGTLSRARRQKLLLGLLILGILLVVVGLRFEDTMWFLSDLASTIGDIIGGIWEWFIWNPVLNGFLVLAITAIIVYFRKPARKVGSAVAIIGLSAAVQKFFQIKRGSQLAIGVLIIITIICAIAGRPVEMWICGAMLMLTLYRGWPRKNPFDPPPMDAFELPVVRAFGLPFFLLLFLGVTLIFFVGMLVTISSGEFYVLIIAMVVAQVAFLLFVDKLPRVTTFWTRITIYPAQNMMSINRSFGGAGEISLVQLKLGPTRFKERKGILDNVLRTLGWHLMEVEPLGARKESGEIETFEFYVNVNGWMFKFEGHEQRGPQAYISWLATERV